MGHVNVSWDWSDREEPPPNLIAAVAEEHGYWKHHDKGGVPDVKKGDLQ